MATTGTTGTLHTGEAAPGATPGTMNDAAAPPATAKRGGMFGGRSNRGEAPVAGDDGVVNRRGAVSVNPGARLGLLISQILTVIAFLVVLGGLSALQRTANNLTLPLQVQQVAYNDVFQSGNQIPYPTDGSRQFGLQWWILWFEVFIFVMILILLVMPRHLLRLKHAAMAFLVYVFVLTTLQINSLLYFNRSPLARGLYGHSRIRATLAGSIMGAICNAFSIIFLGLLREDHRHPGHVGGKRVGADTTGPAAV